VHSLTLTDIHSGWTECAALVVREQTLVVEGIGMIRRQLPFGLRGLDTDNDSVLETSSQCTPACGWLVEETRERVRRLNSQTLSAAEMDVDRFEFAALYTLQHRLA
jgi:hypothetical protein